VAVAVELPSGLHRISPDEYRRLVEAGVFDEDARVELIHGLLLDMSPKTRAHENAIAWLNRLLVTMLDADRYEVRVAAPLTIGSSEPEPDIAVIERSAPRPNHPATATLVIEISVSSLARDLHEKPPVYAQAGVPSYWVVDLDARRVIIHGAPWDETYTRIDVMGEDGELTAPGLGLPPISVAELLAVAAA
jgi:Uma2 family endonuclease